MDLSKIKAVIVCSSLNYKIPDILGSVWYSKLSDLNSNFKEVLDKLEKNSGTVRGSLQGRRREAN